MGIFCCGELQFLENFLLFSNSGDLHSGNYHSTGSMLYDTDTFVTQRKNFKNSIDLQQHLRLAFKTSRSFKRYFVRWT